MNNSKCIRTTHWEFRKQDSINGYNLEFMHKYTSEITNEMWDELESRVKKSNIKIISLCDTFRNTSIKSLTIPDRYLYLFNAVSQCVFMFHGSKIEHIDIKLHNTSLTYIDDFCRNCTKLQCANISLPNVAGIRRGFEGCVELTNLSISINNKVNNYINLQGVCNGCSKLNSLNFKFTRYAFLDLDPRSFRNTNIHNEIISYFEYDHRKYKFRLTNSKPKSVSKIEDVFGKFNKSIVFVETYTNHISKCKSLIV